MIADLLNAATAFVDWLATLDAWSVLLFTFLSTAVEMTFLLGLLVPGESVVMLAGSLPDGPIGFALAVAVGTAGALSGQILGYAVGRVFGARLRTTALGRRIGAERFDRAEAYLSTHGASALVAVRFVAVIHSVVPIVAGTARMPFGRFLGWSALGTLLWVGAFVSAGAVTAEADATGGVGVVLTAIGATCLGLVPLGARLVRRRLPGRSAAAVPAVAEARAVTAVAQARAVPAVAAATAVQAATAVPAVEAVAGASEVAVVRAAVPVDASEPALWSRPARWSRSARWSRPVDASGRRVRPRRGSGCRPVPAVVDAAPSVGTPVRVTRRGHRHRSAPAHRSRCQRPAGAGARRRWHDR